MNRFNRRGPLRERFGRAALRRHGTADLHCLQSAGEGNTDGDPFVMVTRPTRLQAIGTVTQTEPPPKAAPEETSER